MPTLGEIARAVSSLPRSKVSNSRNKVLPRSAALRALREALAPARTRKGRHGAILLPFRTLVAAIERAS